MVTVQNKNLSMRGFTIVELLVASTCMILIIAAGYGIFSQQSRIANNEQEHVILQANAKILMERLSFLFSHVGFGCASSFYAGKKMVGEDPDTNNEVKVDCFFYEIQNENINATSMISDSVVVVYGINEWEPLSSTPSGFSIEFIDEPSPPMDKLASSFKKYLSLFPDDEPNNFYEITGIDSDKKGCTLDREISSDYMHDINVYIVAPTRVKIKDNMLYFQNFVYNNSQFWEIGEWVECMQLQYTKDGSTWYDELSGSDRFKIRGVKIFLLLRSEEEISGYTSNATFTLAGQTVGPFADHYYRELHEQVVWTRNLQ
jgi:hypothetical protein